MKRMVEISAELAIVVVGYLVFSYGMMLQWPDIRSDALGLMMIGITIIVIGLTWVVRR